MADPINPHERRAQALAEITGMQSDLVAAHERIAQLEGQLRDRETFLMREINNQEARAEIAERDRAIYRAEAQLFRAKLVELVTTISMIRKMTDEAEKIKATVDSILHGEMLEDAETEQESVRHVVAGLDQANGNIGRGHAVDLALIEDELGRLAGQPATRAVAPLGQAQS